LISLRDLFSRGGRTQKAAACADAGLAALVAEEEPAGGASSPWEGSARWSAVRLGLAEQLWGDGFVMPGGGAEVLRLAVPIGLSEASSLLLLGAGSGGPPRVLASELGVWVSAYESDPALAAIAAHRIQRGTATVAKHATVDAWEPTAPQFSAHSFHHAIAFDAVHESPPAVLGALREAIQPGGQLVLQELVADGRLDPAESAVADWCRVEDRAPDLPTVADITAELQRLHFDVRVSEDQSARHISQVLQGWQVLVQSLEGAHPSHLFAEALVNEAELWARRISLMHAGKIHLVRWHAFAEKPERPRA
jgi:cyclopropane fatty-acyl-phospholipid synthase-like methyltransferase